MTINRRDFITLGAAGIGSTVLSGAVPLCAAETCNGMPNLSPPSQPAELHIGCHQTLVAGKSFEEKLDFLESAGYDRMEVSGGNYEWMTKNVEAFSKAIKGRKIRYSNLCIGQRGNAGMADATERRAVIDTGKIVLDYAAALKAEGMILCPARKKIELPFPELRERFLSEIVPELAAHAAKLGVNVILEPLNRTETMFLRQVADGASICRDANRPGIGVMGDFWHMTFEETSDMGAFISAGSFLKHVHIASRKNRKIPGLDGEADVYIDGFKGLKLLGYRGAISIEAGYPKDTSDEEKKKLLIKAAELIKTQWAKA